MKTVRIRPVLAALFVVAIAMNSSCDKKDVIGNASERCDEIWTAQVQSEFNAFSEAARTFSTNANEETCATYREAGMEYLDALEAVEDCVTASNQRQEWNKTLEEVKEVLDEVCSSFQD